MINTVNLPPFKKMCMTIGNLPSSFMESLSYYEALCWLYDYFEKTLLPAINTNSEAITELQVAFTTLKNYVDTYFDNLDLQEEVNNKLDEMAEDGTLENLISQYIELQTTYVYNNVSEMKQATNLIEGSFARTSGFYEYNDGGGAYYKIRTLSNSDVVDNIHLFTLDNTDNLVAELIVNDYNILKFGAKSDEDITDILDYIMTIISDGDKLIIPSGEYEVSHAISIDKIISIEGDSIATSVGTRLIFTTNGLILRNSNININNISIQGEKDNYNTLDIDNNVFGKSGIICEYSDTYESGGCKLNNISVSGFNIGVVIYSTRTSNKWSGAYREFKDCDVTYNDIGYLIKDGATYNSIIGGHISSNNKFGLYVDTNILYQNVEIIDTALEINGQQPPFITEITSFGVYVNNESKVKFTNSYLEQTSVFVDNEASVIFVSCHIHNNVTCFGKGQILSDGSHGVFSSKYSMGTDFATNMTSTGCTITNIYGSTAEVCKITSNTIGDIRVNMPNLMNIPIPLKNIESIKFEFDIKINNGYQNTNFGLKATSQILGYGNGNSDSMNLDNNYPTQNMTISDNKWKHMTYYWRPRISLMSDDELLIYSLSWYLFFNKTLSSDNMDFTTNNLDMLFANPRVTIYGKSNV